MEPYHTYDMFPEDIAKALERTDAYYTFNAIADTMHIKSRNLEEPLTDDEKRRIATYFGFNLHRFKVVFDD